MTDGAHSPALTAAERAPRTLLHALDNQEFLAHFQPIVDLRSGAVCGAEALIRWQHPTRGLLSTDTFLPALEVDTFAERAGSLMLDAACEVLVDLRNRGLQLGAGVAVNVSGRQLTTPGLATTILERLARYDVSGVGLTVEITESAKVADVGLAVDELTRLRNAGVRVVADDFGVGWSNLVRLLHLPLSGLKIDRNLVGGMAGDRVRQQMVASTLSLAVTMDLDVIAEGIGTEQVRDLLIGMGCHRGQGWLFSKAVPAADLSAALAMTYPPRGAVARRRAPAARVPVSSADERVEAALGSRPRPVVVADVRGLAGADVPVGVASSAGDGFTTEVLDALPDSTAVLDQWGTIIAVNRAWRMFSVDNGGSPDATGVGVSYLDVCTRAADGGSADALDVVLGLRAVLAGETVESEREYPCPSPEVGRWFTSRITPLTGARRGAVISHANITRRKASEQELLRRASHDPLTGLANRMLFAERLAAALTRRTDPRPHADVGVLYLDLDRFKPVNDTYGHNAGDEVLLAVAHRLRSNVRPQDTVARLGGDEFAICSPATTAAAVVALAERLRLLLAEPHQVHGQRVEVPASIGWYLAAAGHTVNEALHFADEAMYAVKTAARQTSGHTAGSRS